ncbi:MAG: toll/interleukin-1 receptor domain-containing protein [Gammaproteobacteria bacterium]
MIRFVSTFLAHSSADADLVEAVAQELGRRGVFAWLAKDELKIGARLSQSLSQSVTEQATLCAFLSETAIHSDWFEKELVAAMQRDPTENANSLILPVFLGDPLAMVAAKPILNRWLDQKGKSIDIKGIQTDAETPSDVKAARIAEQIADSVFQLQQVSKAPEILINLDQRGSTRRGLPEAVPDNHRHIVGPALLFRPRRGQSHPMETIVGDEWASLSRTISSALDNALEGRRWSSPKNIYISGRMQYSLAWLIGRHFSRKSSATLYCADVHGNRFDNEDWPRTTPLPDGNAHCESNTAIEDIPAIPRSPFNEAIIILSTEYYAKRSLRYLKEAHAEKPIAWIRTPDKLNSSDELRALAADFSALAQRLDVENGCRHGYLILSLPVIAVTLLAAHSPYLLSRFTLLEYRGDLEPESAIADTYAELRLLD